MKTRLQLKSHRFREEREADWRRLEALLRKVEQGSVARLSYDEMVALPALYRAALSSLSVARAISLDRAVVDYLEGLCSRAYFFVYGARTTLWQRLSGFFSSAWPAAVRSVWAETLASLLLTLGGLLAGWLLTARDPDWYFSFVPQDMAGGRDPAASAEQLRKVLYDGGLQDGLSVFATFLFTHNAEVALFAFALGFAFCVPTALLMIVQGCVMGAMFALYARQGLGVELGGWLMIHGVTEMFAVILAGAAGFRIGRTVAFPGDRTRLEAVAEAGRLAATVMAGVLVMLFFAGLLEGFGRQLIKQDLARYAIAAGTGLVWLLYFYVSRGEGRGHGKA